MSQRKRTTPGIVTLASGSHMVTVSRPGEKRERRTFPPDQLADAIAWKAAQEAMKRPAGRGQRAQRVSDKRAILVRDYYTAWMERRTAANAKAPLSEGSAKAYASYFKNWILPELGRVPVRDVDSFAVVALIDSMAEADMTRGAQGQALTALSAMLSDALERGLVAANAVHAVKGKPTSDGRRRVLQPEEYEKLRADAGEEEAFLYALLWSTGVRIGEARGLRVMDVDLERRRILVAEQLGVHDHRRRPTKGRNRRYVPISAELAALLEPRLMAPADSLLVKDESGRALGWHAMADPLKARAERLGIAAPLPTLHSFRHGAVTRWLTAGVPVTQARDWAGHSSLSVTNTYAHALPGMDAHYAALI